MSLGMSVLLECKGCLSCSMIGRCFFELFSSARDELHCNSNEDGISVEGVLHYGKSGHIFRQLVPIASEAQWDKYVKTVMKNEFQCLDLVVRKLSNDHTPHG